MSPATNKLKVLTWGKKDKGAINFKISSSSKSAAYIFPFKAEIVLKSKKSKMEYSRKEMPVLVFLPLQKTLGISPILAGINYPSTYLD